jgi:peptide deformylase
MYFDGRMGEIAYKEGCFSISGAHKTIHIIKKRIKKLI